MDSRKQRSKSGEAETASRALWARATKYRNGKDLDTDDVLDVTHWMRQVTGLILGLVLGFTRTQGMIGFVAYGLCAVLLPLAYLKHVLDINDEEHGGAYQLMTEGLMPSLALYVLAWTSAYSAVSA
mmetsp:Transcript_901/g.2475  ORF Transcript_901/g.2475 Transcript_901/m.2475 type:complete len:126 (-) Transcript_901:188-565(-)